jgi:hypothetical protein
MKRTIIPILFALLCSFAFGACSKSDSSTPTYSMTWTEGTTNYTIPSSSVTSTSTTTNNINVAGATTTSSAALYFFNYTKATGTFPITMSSAGGTTPFATAIYLSNSTPHTPLYGTTTITSVSSTLVQGTFSFTCTDSTKVTNGTFTSKAL